MGKDCSIPVLVSEPVPVPVPVLIVLDDVVVVVVFEMASLNGKNAAEAAAAA